MNSSKTDGVKEKRESRREPLVRIARRDALPQYKAWGIRGAAILISLIVCGFIIFAITKMNPVKVYATMFEGAFGTESRTWITIKDAMLLLCVSVALAPAFKMSYWNIGAEGQVLVGGIATAACMIYFKNLPAPLLFIVMIITSCIAGAIWAVIPAIFKAKWNTNETLFTLMMNYIAVQLTSFFVAKWENPFGSNSVGIINSGTNEGWFPKIFGQTHLLSVLLVLVVTVLMFFYLKYTKQGYEIAVVGASENTARYAGINVFKVIVRTIAISGLVAGFSGFVIVAGNSHTISVNTAGGRGFTAIIIAWLSKFNTLVMILVSLFITFLNRGAKEVASIYQLNDYASEMITGIILFFILGSEFFINYRLIFRARAHKEVA